MISACHNCQYYGTRRCLKCKRIEQDDIRIQHTPHNRDELTVSHIQQPSTPATRLPEDVEDILRRLLCTVTALAPLDALLVLHVAQGGTPSTFGSYINRFKAQCNGYGAEISRATAKAKWESICKRFSPFAALRSWGIGHGGRLASNQQPPKFKQDTLDL